jgi:hypothetical protein
LVGSFTVADVEAESSPILKSKGKLTHLGKNLWMVLVLFLLMTLQVIRQMKLTNLMNFMKNLKSQLVLILELNVGEIKQDEIINNI